MIHQRMYQTVLDQANKGVLPGCDLVKWDTELSSDQISERKQLLTVN